MSNSTWSEKLSGLIRLTEDYQHPSGEGAMSPSDYVTDFLHDDEVRRILCESLSPSAEGGVEAVEELAIAAFKERWSGDDKPDFNQTTPEQEAEVCYCRGYVHATLSRPPASAQGVPDGYAVVPVEPTQEMLIAGLKSEEGGWLEPTENEYELGVIVEYGMAQSDCDVINGDNMETLATKFRAMLAAKGAK